MTTPEKPEAVSQPAGTAPRLEPAPQLISEVAGSNITFVDSIGYANVIDGSFILSLCAAHWTPVEGTSSAHFDPRVVSRLRFNENFARHLHTVIGKMLLSDTKIEGQPN